MSFQPETKVEVPGFGVFYITDDCTSSGCGDRHEITITYFPCKENEHCNGLVIRLDSSGKKVIEELRLYPTEDGFDGIGVA